MCVTEYRRFPLLRSLLVLAGVLAVTVIVLAAGDLSSRGSRGLVEAVGSAAWLDVFADAALVALAVGTVGALVSSWNREQRWPAAAAAIGVAAAYALSEGLKVWVAQPRPCMLRELPVQCPPVGDWSFPSNHATLAFGAVVIIAVGAGRAWLAGVAVVVAVAVAVSRVTVGVHFPHDVAAGALIGVGLPFLFAIGGAVVSHRAGRVRGSDASRGTA